MTIWVFLSPCGQLNLISILRIVHHLIEQLKNARILLKYKVIATAIVTKQSVTVKTKPKKKMSSKTNKYNSTK